jgi:hypothetical protein
MPALPKSRVPSELHMEDLDNTALIQTLLAIGAKRRELMVQIRSAYKEGNRERVLFLVGRLIGIDDEQNA